MDEEEARFPCNVKYRRAHYLGRLYRVRPTEDHRHYPSRASLSGTGPIIANRKRSLGERMGKNSISGWGQHE
ncbi:hypothetical protein N7509_009158 [Penicillium cosmopolitanum]|uniref:Uncharacterized protein n=1 Tax=Penicillium cosmopolitanum TaxID=1131564 RepID=A0A9X0B3D4_9EURO|nr:uncharacterized protein N7509_009158 [Penicillium cosmopolitanum]KAJ5386617.1 hypothetical protein N7509_009158 [Penicillium cosmopolitanum]